MLQWRYYTVSYFCTRDSYAQLQKLQLRHFAKKLINTCASIWNCGCTQRLELQFLTFSIYVICWLPLQSCVYIKLFLVMVYFSKWHRGEGCWRIKWESLTWGEDMAVVVVGQRVLGGGERGQKWNHCLIFEWRNFLIECRN